MSRNTHNTIVYDLKFKIYSRDVIIGLVEVGAPLKVEKT